MRTKLHLFLLLGLCSVSLVLLACDPPETPALCLFTATPNDSDTDTDPKSVDARHCPPGFHVQDGQGFYILHQLPREITPPGPVQLSLITPCTTVKIEATYTIEDTIDGDASISKALVPVTAPAGTSCSLIVTAAIANHQAQAVSAGTAEDCANMGASCADSTDASAQ